MAVKILIIEDEINAAELARFQLQRAGYDVYIATDGTDGLRQAYAWQPDLILLDIMMPGMNGWAVCKRLREVTDVPIIFLTALDQEKHIVRGLGIGADDYIAKPYGPGELLARVGAVLRRHTVDTSPPSGVYVHGDLEIDFDRHKITRGDTTIELTPLEFKLLSCLAERPGKSFSHLYLLRRVWGAEKQSRNALKLYIWYLRQKLELDPAHPAIILTDYGVGYRLARPQR